MIDPITILLSAVMNALAETKILGTIDEYRNQFKATANEYPFLLPAIGLQIAQLDWVDLLRNEQRGSGILRVYIAQKNTSNSRQGSPSQAKAFERYQTIHSIHSTLQGFKGGGLIDPLSRVFTEFDTDPDSVFEDYIDYTFSIEDSTESQVQKEKLTGVIPNIEVQKWQNLE